MPSQLGFPWQSAPLPRLSRGRRTSALVPRMAPAVRISDPRLSQAPLLFATIGPQIFVHEGARQALERRFELACQGPVQLAVTDNLRRMISHTKVRGTLRVRVHMMFLGAPDRVRQALVDYVARGDRRGSTIVGDYIHANTHRIRASRPVAFPVRAQGKVHDLAKILAQLNTEYFGGVLTDVLITWGRNGSAKQKRSTIKLGSYSATERLIRIHPVLDHEWVPRYFVSYIVYHELLHHLIPVARTGGPGSLHSPEFLARERDFRHYQRALDWEQKHIDRLLRAK
jgi:hypothetical protein